METMDKGDYCNIIITIITINKLKNPKTVLKQMRAEEVKEVNFVQSL